MLSLKVDHVSIDMFVIIYWYTFFTHENTFVTNENTVLENESTFLQK